MRYEKPVKLSEVLNSSRLTPLLAGSALRGTHDAIWQQIVDVSLRSSCRLSSLRDGVLTISADLATTASQLRYLNRILLQQLHNHAEFKDVQRLRIVVKTAEARPVKAAKSLPRLSEATAKHLENAANAIGSGELSGALRQLARNSLTRKKD